jgi:hypothetical protein
MKKIFVSLLLISSNLLAQDTTYIGDTSVISMAVPANKIYKISGTLTMRPGSGINILGDASGGLLITGKLDIQGTPKQSWTNAVGSISAGQTTFNVVNASGWNAGDEIAIVPTAINDYYNYEVRAISNISGNTITVSVPFVFSHPQVENWTAEIMNLTRDINITGNGFIQITSNQPQVVKYVATRYMGHRKDVNGDGIKEMVLGKYVWHNHHSGDGSRGSIWEGVVARDSYNHVYVSHDSHGITYRNNVAFNTDETPFWWDEGFSNGSHDIIWEGNIAANTTFTARSLMLDAGDPSSTNSPRTFSVAYNLTNGDNNIARNNVAVGTYGDHHTGAGFKWEAISNDHKEGIWEFKNNLAHNNACGLSVWQNTSNNHIVQDHNSYNNFLEIYHGAYGNNYKYIGGQIKGQLVVHAASSNTARIRFENMTIDSVLVEGSPGTSTLPILFRNCNIIKYQSAVSPNPHNTDLVQCTIGSIEMHPLSNPAERVRVQSVSGQATVYTKDGSANINPFAPAIWGDGTGLTGEYFNNPDFTNPAFSRVDAFIGFSEWNNDIDYRIIDKTISVRWVGKVQAQFSETHTFMMLTSGSHKLWVNNQLIINANTPGSMTSGSIALVAGQKYDIKIEFSNPDNDLSPGVNLYWLSSSINSFCMMGDNNPTGGEYVPQSQLFTNTVLSTTPKPTVVKREKKSNLFVSNFSTLNSDKIYQYSLFDIAGRLIKRGAVKVGRNEFDIATGVYILKLNNGENFKIIKQ